MLISYSCTLLILFFSGFSTTSQPADSVRHCLSTASGSEKMEHLIELGNFHKNRNANEALNYYKEALNLAYELNLPGKASQITRYIGACYYNLNQSGRALEFYRKALEQGRAIGDSSLVSPALYNIALLYIKDNDYNTALPYLFGSININLLLENFVNLGYDYNQLGVIYSRLGSLSKSDSLFDLSRSIRAEIHRESLGYTFFNIANNFYTKKIYDSARCYFHRAKELLFEYGDVYSALDAYRLEANILWYQDEHVQSRLIFEEVKDQYLEIGDIDGAFYAYISLGVTDNRLNGPAEASIQYQKALELGLEHQLDPNLMIEVYEKLYRNAMNQKDYKESLSYMEKYIEAYSNMKSNQLAESMAIYESQNEVLQEKYALLKKNKEQQIKAQKTKIRMVIFLAIIVLLISALLFFFILIRDKNQSYGLLQLRNNQINKQQAELKEAYQKVEDLNRDLLKMVDSRTTELNKTIEQLKKQNNQLEDYAFINSHKVRGVVARILGLFTLWKDKLYKNRQEEFDLLNMAAEESKKLDIVINDLNQKLVNEAKHHRYDADD